MYFPSWHKSRIGSVVYVVKLEEDRSAAVSHISIYYGDYGYVVSVA